MNVRLGSTQPEIASSKSLLQEILNTSMLDPSSAGFKNKSLNGLSWLKKGFSKSFSISSNDEMVIQFGVGILLSLRSTLQVFLFQVFTQA